MKILLCNIVVCAVSISAITYGADTIDTKDSNPGAGSVYKTPDRSLQSSRSDVDVRSAPSVRSVLTSQQVYHVNQCLKSIIEMYKGLPRDVLYPKLTDGQSRSKNIEDLVLEGSKNLAKSYSVVTQMLQESEALRKKGEDKALSEVKEVKRALSAEEQRRVAAEAETLKWKKITACIGVTTSSVIIALIYLFVGAK
jgi:hypothetical protein